MGIRKLLSQAVKKFDEAVPAIRKNTLPDEIPAQVVGKRTPSVKPIPDISDAEVIAPKVSTMDAALQWSKENPGKVLTGATLAEIGRRKLSSTGEDNSEEASPILAKIKENTPVDSGIPADYMPKAIAESKEQPLQTRSNTEANIPKNTQEIKQAEHPVEETALPKSKSFEEMLMDAQEESKRNRKNAVLTRAGELVGAGLARITPSHSLSDAEMAQAGQPIEDMKARIGAKKEQQAYDKAEKEKEDDVALADPNSEISKMTREQLAKFGINVKTAEQAKQLNPQIFNLISQQRAQQSAKEIAQLSHSAKAGQGASTFIKGAQKQLLKPYQEYQKISTATNSLEKLANSKESGPNDVAILYDFIKTLDPNSVVREGEITLSRQGMSQLEALGVKVNRLSKGVLLSPEFRQGIVQIAKNKKEQALNNYNQIKQPFLEEAESIGMSPDDMKRFDYGHTQQAEKSTTIGTAALTPAQEQAVQHVMTQNNASREQAIGALKKAGKL